MESKEGGPIAKFLHRIFKEHGAPTYLHSDNGTEFVNRFVKDVCNKYNIRIVHGRPYHPQSQGQVENLNRRVKNCLRHFLLSYTEDQRAEVWPSLVKDIEYFINHSWHHTVRSAPYNVFFGRFQTRNMGKVPPQPEFMEEDFLLDNNVTENELEFELNIADSGVVSLPNYEHDNDVRVRLAHMQTFQEQQKHDVFEATEANIAHNKRSQVKKIRARSFSVGEAVLFKNPCRSTIATTLNVEDMIEEKVGRDLYRVSYSDEHIVLFATEMVPAGTTCSRTTTTPDDHEQNKSMQWEPRLVLERISQYADLQRSFFLARKKYKPDLDFKDMECIIGDVGYKVKLDEKADLVSIFYLALYCGFLSTLTEDGQWEADLEKYCNTLLAFLQQNHFHYFLSGIYWWDCFRYQSVHFLTQCMMEKSIPLFHYCSECIDDGPCTHHCCNIWLIQACMKRGIDCEHSKMTITSVSSPYHDGLMLLATVATEKMNATQTCSKAAVSPKIINEIKPVRNQSSERSATKLQTLDSFLQHTHKAKQTENVSIKKPMSEGEKKKL